MADLKPRIRLSWMQVGWVCYVKEQNIFNFLYRPFGRGSTPEEAYADWKRKCQAK